MMKVAATKTIVVDYGYMELEDVVREDNRNAFGLEVAHVVTEDGGRVHVHLSFRYRVDAVIYFARFLGTDAEFAASIVDDRLNHSHNS